MSMDDLKAIMVELTDKTNKKIEESHTTIRTDIEKTNGKIDSIQKTIKTDIGQIQSRIEKVENEIYSKASVDTVAELSLQIEHLKQDRLRNNIRVTGLPQNAFNDPDDAILRIDSILKTDLIPSDWTVHADRFKSFVRKPHHQTLLHGKNAQQTNTISRGNLRKCQIQFPHLHE